MANARQKKPLLSPQAKRNLGNVFGSLISNQRAINSAKELPFWVWIIFLVISAFIPVIPTMVTTSRTYGSAFMNANYNYGADVGLHQVSQKLSKAGYDFKIEGQDNKLVMYHNNQKFVDEIETSDPVDNNPYAFSYIDSTKKGTEEMLGQYAFRFVYTTDANYSSVFSKLTTTKYAVGTTLNAGSVEGSTPYIPSFILLSPSTMSCVLYKTDSTTVAASSYGGATYNHFEKDTFILASMNLTSATQKEVFNKWCDLFNLSYMDAKALLFRNNTLIFVGVYLGTILFMGLLIFLLTRGRNNVFHYLSLYTCEKIAFYAALSPAILSLCLGFAIPAMATMSFILFFGLRIMWISMRQLRPQ